MAELEGGDIFCDDFLQEATAAAGSGQVSEIQHFFADATVFVTGATGLLGQIIIEKLLRSTKVRKIYVLMRPKDKKSAEKRLNEVLSSALFRRVTQTRWDISTTVTPLLGDCEAPSLGLTQEDQDIITREVDVVIHAACASCDVTSLKTSLSVNVGGTKKMLDLARQMRRVKSIICISSAYSTGLDGDGQEKISEPPISHQKLLQLTEILDNETLQLLRSSMILGWADTNTFSQHIAESMIREEEGGLPIAIVRPSILVSTAFEPIVGWVSNSKGPQCLAYESISGVNRVFHSCPGLRADIVPADIAANAVIALAADVGKSRSDGPNIEDLSQIECSSRPDVVVPVLNITSGLNNPITWYSFIHLCFCYGVNIPKMTDSFMPFLAIHSSRAMVTFKRWIYHYLPAAILDTILYLTGRQPKWINRYNRLHAQARSFEPYSLYNWKFHNKNSKELWKRLSARDKALYNFNVASVDWNQYMKTYIRGIRTYVGKEDMNTLPAARRRMTKIKIVYKTATSLVTAAATVIVAWYYVFALIQAKNKMIL